MGCGVWTAAFDAVEIAARDESMETPMTGIMRMPAVRIAGRGASRPRIDPWRLATLIGICLLAAGEIYCVVKVVGSMIWPHSA